MSLDEHGQLSAAVIAFYIPISILTLFLVIRHGIRRDAGWIFLFTFSLIRITGGALLIAAESTRPAKIGLYVTAYIFESVGLAPLLLATVGFLRVVGKHSFSTTSNAQRGFRFIGILATVALVLSIGAGVDASSSSTKTQHAGLTLRRVAVLVYVAIFILVVLAHLWAWRYSDQIPRHHRTLLIAISSTIPFLTVRMLYAILNAFSGNVAFSTGTSHSSSSSIPPHGNSLMKFNTISGDWRIYLSMSLLMEYITVLIYVIAGLSIPYSKDERPDKEQFDMTPGIER